MCQAAALLAACYLAHWEIIDYASDARTDVPSGTARELAERLGEIRQPEVGYTLRELHGPKEARGVAVAVPKSTLCGFRASSSPPRWSSLGPTSG